MGIACSIVVLALTQLAQTQFEVASIKHSAPNARGMTMYNPTGGRFTVEAITAKGLIAYAYDVREFQVSGGPNWLDSDRYDIVAKFPSDANAAQIREMARTLLADRLNLELHRESKDQLTLALVQAKGGAKLQPTAGQGPDVRGGGGRLIGRKITMAILATMLADRVLGRPVLDRTGISGEFDITLDYSPEASPSIFTALQEQLGLKLESQKAPVEILIVDRIEKPSAN